MGSLVCISPPDRFNGIPQKGPDRTIPEKPCSALFFSLSRRAGFVNNGRPGAGPGATELVRSAWSTSSFAFMYNGGYLGDIYFWKLEEIDRLSQNYSFLSKDYFAFASMEGVEVYYLSLLDGKVYAYNFEDKEENCIADNFLDWLQEIVL